MRTELDSMDPLSTTDQAFQQAVQDLLGSGEILVVIRFVCGGARHTLGTEAFLLRNGSESAIREACTIELEGI
jgi:hypothetical protein